MNNFLKPLALLAAISAFGMLPASAAVEISDANLFSGILPQTTPEYPNLAYPPVYVTDGTINTFVFSDSADANPRMILTGFNSSIDTLRIFSGGDSRASTAITIYYGATINNPAVNTSLSNAGLTFLGTYSLPNDNTNYTEFTTSQGYHYDQLNNLGIPDGTKTIYISYAMSTLGYGPAVGELQAYAVPEPATWALALVAGGILIVACKKSRRTA